MESSDLAIEAREVRHRYGDHPALDGLDLQVPRGQIYALLGPNGSGKTTLFRILCTLMPLQSGRVRVAGVDVAADPMEVRRRIGIVFQSPSLDKKLTVEENIACQGALYGLSGRPLQQRREEVMRQVGLTELGGRRCESLSGGFKRRVELAKGMLHRPQVLLLDEPSTGLDPAARLDFWEALTGLARQGVTVVLTTHLLEEADKADRIALLDRGRVVAEGSPDELRGEMGSGLVTVQTDDTSRAARLVQEHLGMEAQQVQQQIRLRSDDPAALVPQLAQLLGPTARTITIGRPGLEDVFIARTGHRFWGVQNDVAEES